VKCYFPLGIVLLCSSAGVVAQTAPAVYATRSYELDSGYRSNPTPAVATVYRGTVRFDQAAWLRLLFKHTNLPAGSRLRLTAAADGAVQWFDGASLADYQNGSAYFNGNEVTVELLAAAGSVGNRVFVDAVEVGDPGMIPYPESLCGADDRVPSQDPRQGRQYPTGCTSWMINEFTVLTAGHCTTSSSQQIHFNVPFSTSSGSLVLPPPQDQYPYAAGTLQRLNAGIGSDWSVACTTRNSNTGLWPGQAQAARAAAFGVPYAWYDLGTVPTSTAGNVIRITGYGTVSSPISPTWNQVQKTHADSLTQINATSLRYIPDTTGGNSGSPVIHENTGRAIGIHTHAGCTTGGNQGTRIDRADLQAAIASISRSKVVGKVTAFGAGCRGSAGVPTLGHTGFPRIGTSMTLNVTGVLPGQAGGVFYGFSRTMWGVLNLPYAIPGAPGCSVFSSLDIAVAAGTGSGSVNIPLAVPNNAALVNGIVDAQYLSGDVAANARGLTTTNSLELQVGRD
jgi:V8-like Glu-specific endopeptidase